MDQTFDVEYFCPRQCGVEIHSDGVSFSAAFDFSGDCGLILYHNSGKTHRIPFRKEYRTGQVYGLKLKGLNYREYEYNYYQGKKVFSDKYSAGISGYEIYGGGFREPRLTRSRFMDHSLYDWKEDRPLRMPYEDMVAYSLNVRTFTCHKSSRVKYRGTFEGIIEKIPYLKDLGITAVELMPCHEYEECEITPEQKNKNTMEYAASHYQMEPEQENSRKVLNCWGYKEGYYFAPKASYSARKEPVTSFKDMVRALHKEGIEVIVQFYCNTESDIFLIPEVVRYWVINYHIDGCHLIGPEVPLSALAWDPILRETKIWYQGFSWEKIYGDKEPLNRNLAVYHDSFKAVSRCFLKGDENMTVPFLEHQRRNPSCYGVINYISDTNGFTLYDMVSYDRKHNEENGENNQDGTEYNWSWNCGVEGATRKKSVLQLRIRQMKNALSLLFLSQGTPCLFAGDELANTRYGNNNPYCQDNETGWVKWSSNKMNQEIREFTKQLISLRKSHPVLRQPRELRIMDYLSCGYPDLSYHGQEAWRPDLTPGSRYVGMMLCGKYTGKEECEDDYFFIAFNMHWIPHKFALPNLPREMKWTALLNTAGTPERILIGEDALKEKEVYQAEVKERSISIFISDTGTSIDSFRNGKLL